MPCLFASVLKSASAEAVSTMMKLGPKSVCSLSNEPGDPPERRPLFLLCVQDVFRHFGIEVEAVEFLQDHEIV